MKLKRKTIFLGMLCIVVLPGLIFGQTGQPVNSWVWVTSAPLAAASGVAVCCYFISLTPQQRLDILQYLREQFYKIKEIKGG